MKVKDFGDRAFDAYFRYFGKDAPQPSSQADYHSLKGKEYVVLSNIRGVLACYRINAKGALRRVASTPKEIAEFY